MSYLDEGLQGVNIQTGVVGQETELLHLQLLSVAALGVTLQCLEDPGPQQQVAEVGQSQQARPAHPVRPEGALAESGPGHSGGASLPATSNTTLIGYRQTGCSVLAQQVAWKLSDFTCGHLDKDTHIHAHIQIRMWWQALVSSSENK